MKKIILISVLFLAFNFVDAQQINMFSQYMFNQYSINPAVAGTKDYIPVTLSYRRLWTGIDDAPTIQMISGHTSISDEMAVGAKVFSYSAGPNVKTGFEGTYAYAFSLTETSKLSLGLSAQLNQYYLDKSKLSFEDASEPTMTSGSEKLILPDANFGVYYYDKNYYAGLAVQQLFGRKVTLLNENLEQRQVRHYFLHGGYNYEINDDFAVEPSVLLRFIEAGVFQADINAKVEYKKLAYLGFSYRSQDAVVAMIGINNKALQFGYAYDFTLSDIRKYSLGTHEIMFTYKIGNSSSKSSSE